MISTIKNWIQASKNWIQARRFLALAAAAIAAWILWAQLHHILRLLSSPISIEKLGQWGDSFGALNVLFAALACIAVVATFWTQQEGLNNQQKQIDDSRKEQNKQRFENSFFQLLELLRDLRKEVKFSRTGSTSQTGPDALKLFYRHFIQDITASTIYDEQLSEEDIATRYEQITGMDTENELGPYFRIIYTILRRTSEDKNLSDDDKIKYGNLVRSQLSTSEIALIGLNGLTKQSNDFRKYIIQFRLLKYLVDGPVRRQLEGIYPNETFDSRD